MHQLFKYHLSVMVLFLLLLVHACDMVQIDVKGDSGTTSRLKNCDGLRIDLIIGQDSSGSNIYNGEIEEGILKFNLSGENYFDFRRNLTMMFVVKENVENKNCQFRSGSMYKADRINLKPVGIFKEHYEIELNKFRKIY